MESIDTASLRPGLAPAPQNSWNSFHHSRSAPALTPKEWQARALGLPFSVSAPAVPLIGAGEGPVARGGTSARGQGATTRHAGRRRLCGTHHARRLGPAGDSHGCPAPPGSAGPAVTGAALLLSRCLLKMVKENIVVPEEILSFCCNGLQVPPRAVQLTPGSRWQLLTTAVPGRCRPVPGAALSPAPAPVAPAPHQHPRPFAGYRRVRAVPTRCRLFP